MLEIKNLYVNIEKNEILKDFSLTIKEGEVHALMGLNGCGKSTLVKSIAGHYECKITQGQINYNKEDILSLQADERANKGIFLSFQNPIEIEGINNSYFLKAAYNAKRKYQNKKDLDSLEFIKFLNSKLKKFDLDKSLLKRELNFGFSGGEKKRNELLQILVLEPNLILLDEIDSGLDINTLKIVSKIINSLLNKKVSVLMITHYNRLLEEIKPTHVHIMQDGKIVQTGNSSLAKKLDQEGFKKIRNNHEKSN